MKITTNVITRSALILALAIAIQSIRLPQYVTGPVINALLFFAVVAIGPVSAIMIGLLTPIIAFAFGIMPLAPAVPVIILGNASLAVTFGLFIKKPYFGVAAAALVKYGTMFLSVKYILPLLLNISLPPKVVATLTTPQLFTAIVGGIIALAVIKGYEWQSR